MRAYICSTSKSTLQVDSPGPWPCCSTDLSLLLATICGLRWKMPIPRNKFQIPTQLQVACTVQYNIVGQSRCFCQFSFLMSLFRRPCVQHKNLLSPLTKPVFSVVRSPPRTFHTYPAKMDSQLTPVFTPDACPRKHPTMPWTSL